MSRNNDVFHLLVTKGNQEVLAKDKKVTELLPGQIGIFNYDTNLSFDATVATAPRNFYLAVGVDAGMLFMRFPPDRNPEPQLHPLRKRAPYCPPA